MNKKLTKSNYGVNIHELKILPAYFKEVESGNMTFEIRKRDRNYQVGDILILKEWLGDFTGSEITKEITFILNNKEYLQDGYVALAIK